MHWKNVNTSSYIILNTENAQHDMWGNYTTYAGIFATGWRK